MHKKTVFYFLLTFYFRFNLQKNYVKTVDIDRECGIMMTVIAKGHSPGEMSESCMSFFERSGGCLDRLTCNQL